MGAVEKLVLVTSRTLPLNRHFRKIAWRLSRELGKELEVREEDYEFLSKYGEKDDFGMTWLPQLFAALSDGSIVKVLTEPNLTPQGTLDEELDYKIALKNIKKAEGSE